MTECLPCAGTFLGSSRVLFNPGLINWEPQASQVDKETEEEGCPERPRLCKVLSVEARLVCIRAVLQPA